MIKVKDVTQARDYQWVCPETGHRLSSLNYLLLEDAAKLYRRANGLPIPSTWSEQFEANVCAHSPGVCANFEPPTLRQKAASASKALLGYVASGLKTRTQEEVEAILTTHCRPCEYYGGETGVLKIACTKCGCSKLKLFMATQHCPVKKW